MFFLTIDLNAVNPASYANLNIIFLFDRLATFGTVSRNSTEYLKTNVQSSSSITTASFVFCIFVFFAI